MTAGELIAKLQQVDPNTLVCGVDGELGLHADVEAWELTARVDRDPLGHPFYVDEYIGRGIVGTEINERVVAISRWGHHHGITGPNRAKEL